MADGDCDYVTDDVPQILGRPAGSFERFAVDYAEAFSRGTAATALTPPGVVPAVATNRAFASREK